MLYVDIHDKESKKVLESIKSEINEIYKDIEFLAEITYITYDEILAYVGRMEDYSKLADYMRFFIDKAEMR